MGDPQGVRFERMDALVDTGATYLGAPRNVLADLGRRTTERREFVLADDGVAKYEVGMVSLNGDGRTIPALCVFGDEDSEPLLGAVALENFLLAADPVNKRLVPDLGRLM